ncbi:MAG: aminoacyl-tRNA hydrolase, partial [Erysipelotrichaceae bacterium]
MRPKGSDGGHNGLAHISATLATTEYPRIRFGIGNSFHKGKQVDFVLGRWSSEEKKFIDERISIVIDMIRSFAFAGLELTMTAFNKAGKDKNQSDQDPKNVSANFHIPFLLAQRQHN